MEWWLQMDIVSAVLTSKVEGVRRIGVVDVCTGGVCSWVCVGCGVPRAPRAAQGAGLSFDGQSTLGRRCASRTHT